MLIQDLVDTKVYFEANNEPKYLTSEEIMYELNKAILYAIVRQYIEGETILGSDMNKIYSIIWGKCSPGLQSALKENKEYPIK